MALKCLSTPRIYDLPNQTLCNFPAILSPSLIGDVPWLYPLRSLLPASHAPSSLASAGAHAAPSLCLRLCCPFPLRLCSPALFSALSSAAGAPPSRAPTLTLVGNAADRRACLHWVRVAVTLR